MPTSTEERPVIAHRFAAVAIVDTGGQPAEIAETAEVAVVTVDAGVPSCYPPLSWLVRPASPIAPHAVRAHRLCDADVAGAPAIAEVAGEIAGVISDRILLAHRSAQIRRLLGAALPGWRPTRVLDTRRLAGLVWPARGRALVELTRRVGLTVPGQVGRAGWDAHATALLFTVLAHRLRLPAGCLFPLATPPGQGPPRCPRAVSPGRSRVPSTRPDLG